MAAACRSGDGDFADAWPSSSICRRVAELAGRAARARCRRRAAWSPAGSGSSAPTSSTRSSAAGASVAVVDALVDGHGGDPAQRRRPGRRRPRARRSAIRAVREVLRRRRRRVQPRRPGQPHRLDARPAARPAAQRRCRTPRSSSTSGRSTPARGSCTRPPARCTASPRRAGRRGPRRPPGRRQRRRQARRRAAPPRSTPRPTGCAITSLRLTNVYGPRQRLTSDQLGFLPVFFRKALRGEQHPDLRRRHAAPRLPARRRRRRRARRRHRPTASVGEVFNVGSPRDESLAAIAKLIVDATGSHGGMAAGAVAGGASSASTSARSAPTAATHPPAALGWQLAGRARRRASPPRSTSTGEMRGTCRRPEPCAARASPLGSARSPRQRRRPAGRSCSARAPRRSRSASPRGPAPRHACAVCVGRVGAAAGDGRHRRRSRRRGDRAELHRRADRLGGRWRSVPSPVLADVDAATACLDAGGGRSAAHGHAPRR